MANREWQMASGGALLAIRHSPTSPEPEARDHLAADHVAKRMLALAVAGGAGDDHQRQEVLLARMAGARMRGLVPGRKPRLALLRRRLCGCVEPRVKAAEASSPPSKKWRKSW